jgi:hypothetical protein
VLIGGALDLMSAPRLAVQIGVEEISPDFSVRPNGADHQWGKDPPKEVVG